MDTPETHGPTTEDIQKAEVEGDKAPTTPAAESSPAETQDHKRIFEHSAFVHVGPGAEECEHVDEDTYVATCTDSEHFHAWIHTPNQFQHNSIRTKALAAKARKMRLLRDTESDVRVILDGELEQIRISGNREILIEEIVNKDAVKSYWQAMREVQEDEKFEHYNEDRDKLAALHKTDEKDRDEEEFNALVKHMAEYDDLVKTAIDAIQTPVRESLAERDMDALLEIVTEDRIQAESLEEFEDVYAQWEWYIGTCRLLAKPSPGHPTDRVYGDVEQLKAAPEEVVSAIATAFTALDADAARALGNS